jgi:Uma2 family endonuclease
LLFCDSPPAALTLVPFAAHNSAMNARIDFSHLSAPMPRYRVTIDDFYRMGEAGVFDGKPRVELIEGDVIGMAPIGTVHASTTRLLADHFNHRIAQCFVSVQQPIHLSEGSEPEPDIAIVRGHNRDYRARHPGAADCLLIIEIAHTTQTYDREVKAPLYAAYGVVEYWLIDTVANTVTVFRDPVEGRYRYCVEHPGATIIEPLDALLPPVNVSDVVNA